MIFKKLTQFIRAEYDHWYISRLQQMKFEKEIELKRWQDLNDGTSRIHDQIEIIEEELISIRMRLANKLERMDQK